MCIKYQYYCYFSNCTFQSQAVTGTTKYFFPYIYISLTSWNTPADHNLNYNAPLMELVIVFCLLMHEMCRNVFGWLLCKSFLTGVKMLRVLIKCALRPKIDFITVTYNLIFSFLHTVSVPFTQTSAQSIF